jgi:uncharacterized protein (TIGR03435 family)
MSRQRNFSILILAVRAVLAQSNPKEEFEVVSIRPHLGLVTVSSNGINGATYRAVAITLMDLVTDAYGIQEMQVSGEPGWADSDHYDIEAKAGGDGALTWDRARPMLQSMLAERFKMKARREMKEVAAYDLVVAKQGPKFKENTDPAAHARMGTSASLAGIHVRATKATMARLTIQLSINAGRPVVDKTGLNGGYDFNLAWAPDNSPAAIDGSTPTLFTALQEQLGLKLESSRTMQEMLVIESAEKPSGN